MLDDKKLAVLIDGDNVSHKYINVIFEELSNISPTTYRRIYGDWTDKAMSSWKTHLQSFSITPIQQFSNTHGKNATDSALIIDAMDILYANNVDGFCIVASDGDYTKLASRLRESGMLVIGMGETKTPTSFIKACNDFKYLDKILSMAKYSNSESLDAPMPAEPVSPDIPNILTSKDIIKKEIAAIISEKSGDDGFMPLSQVGIILKRRHPDFDTRNYGHSKLSAFVKSLNFHVGNFTPKKGEAPVAKIKLTSQE